MGRLILKVVPGSSREEIVGWLGDSLKVKVKAPPETGRANEAVIALLADRLGLWNRTTNSGTCRFTTRRSTRRSTAWRI
jgi:uncharacterized protein YggU (UPF0235/DUF167 family)